MLVWRQGDKIPLTAERTLRVLGVRDDDADQPPLAGVERVDAAEAIREARAEAAVPRSYPQTRIRRQRRRRSLLIERADARTRTGDPFITSEVLYQLSYVGLGQSA